MHLLLGVVCLLGCVAGVSVNRAIEGSGFHRYINTSVSGIEVTHSYCTLAVKQQVTNTFFLDLDELHERLLYGENEIPRIVPVDFEGSIDVERPSDVAGNYTVWMLIPVFTSECSWRVPFHLRYQTPSNVSFLKFVFPKPLSMLIYCSDEKLTSNHPELGSVDLPLPHMDDLNFEVPVGMLQHYVFVGSVSHFVTFSFAVWLGYTALRFRFQKYKEE